MPKLFLWNTKFNNTIIVWVFKKMPNWNTLDYYKKYSVEYNKKTNVTNINWNDAWDYKNYRIYDTFIPLNNDVYYKKRYAKIYKIAKRNGFLNKGNIVKKNVKNTKPKETKVAKKSTKKRKLSGNALKQKAYSLLKNGTAKLVYNRGQGRSVNTRYSKCKSRKMPKYVYVYELKARKK